jgi:hypothetical protein
MGPPPNEIEGAKVVYYAIVDEHCRPTGKCKHWRGKVLLGPVASLAICQYENEKSLYLFFCNGRWEPETDTWHETVEEAKRQAEFEYEGISQKWQPFPFDHHE